MKTFLLLYQRGDGSENYLNVYAFDGQDARKQAVEWCAIGTFKMVELIEV
jgi:hypothetical protein